MAFAALLLCAACGEQKPEVAALCPSQAETEAAVTAYITKTYWSTGQRDIWKIAAVDGFSFSAIQAGAVIKKQVEYDGVARDVCPIRLTYSFKVHHQDGRTETIEMGADKIQLFYKDAYNGWTFKTD